MWYIFLFCLQMPQTENEWKQIAHDFWTRWNFPNCIGSIDGKHVNMKCPANSGSSYFNYKSRFSTVLMAIVDAKYNFIYVNIGSKGSASDGGIFNSTPFYQKMMNNQLNIPENQRLPGRDVPVPYCLIADDAFSADKHLLKPYSKRNLSMPERIFNYRLSRARRVVENAFGIAAARWRILLITMEQKYGNVVHIISAICVLHNFCMRECSTAYATNTELTEANWNDAVNRVAPINADLNNINTIRKEFEDFFVREGEVQWQYESI